MSCGSLLPTKVPEKPIPRPTRVNAEPCLTEPLPDTLLVVLRRVEEEYDPDIDGADYSELVYMTMHSLDHYKENRAADRAWMRAAWKKCGDRNVD